MAVQAVLTLNTKAYNPRGKTGDIASWALVGDASFGGAISSVTESVTGPSKDGVNRIRFRLIVPKAASADSTCACTGEVLGQALADVSIVVPAVFTSAERTDFRTRLQALVANAITTAAIDNLEGAW